MALKMHECLCESVILTTGLLFFYQSKRFLQENHKRRMIHQGILRQIRLLVVAVAGYTYPQVSW